jgi:hypothetical protein
MNESKREIIPSMMLRFGAVLRAFQDGCRRAASAPALLLGAMALTYLFSGPLDPSLSRVAVFTQYVAVLAALPFGGTLYGLQEPAWVVIWAFLAGGILDRYARDRPTRGRGFFGACGAHFPALLRLGVPEWLIGLVAVRTLDGYVPIAVALGASVFFLYARVRLVVEDRRSAIGALLASGRFIRRNFAAVPLALAFAAAMWLVIWVWQRRTIAPVDSTFLRFAEVELTVALLLFLLMGSWASAVAFFQSRLAHASYTAGPPLEWPESPAAEAITNLSPRA